VGDGNVDGEIPLLSSFLYLLGEAERVRRSLRRRLSRCSRAKRAEWREARRAVLGPTAAERRHMLPRDPIRGHCQAGSLTGAVHLSKNNAGVLRPAQRGQKPRVEQKGKSWLDPDVQYA
jgi:hypothetical protein